MLAVWRAGLQSGEMVGIHVVSRGMRRFAETLFHCVVCLIDRVQSAVLRLRVFLPNCARHHAKVLIIFFRSKQVEFSKMLPRHDSIDYFY